jgi:ribosomal protein S18 acetylase RimI-like enzyme
LKNEIYDECKIIHLVLSNEKHRQAFYDLNAEWLEEYFVVEDIDKIILSDPEKIIKNEGFILLAQYKDQFIGTISLIKDVDGEYELSKLGVTKKFKGFGIAKKLMDEFFKISREKGINRLYIASNRSLVPAITLYEKYGFIEVSEDRHSQFERGNITMKCVLV